MISLLPPEAVAEVARALHATLNAPPTAGERRVGLIHDRYLRRRRVERYVLVYLITP